MAAGPDPAAKSTATASDPKAKLSATDPVSEATFNAASTLISAAAGRAADADPALPARPDPRGLPLPLCSTFTGTHKVSLPRGLPWTSVFPVAFLPWTPSSPGTRHVDSPRQPSPWPSYASLLRDYLASLYPSTPHAQDVGKERRDSD